MMPTIAERLAQSNKDKKLHKKSLNSKKEKNGNAGKMVMAPAAYTKVVTNRGGSQGATKGGVRIRNREFIGDLSTATVFSASGFRLNPADPNTFPRLQLQAVTYEQYKFHKLHFEYVPTCPTSTAGRIIFSPDYDEKDGENVTLPSLLNHKDSMSSAYWKGFICKLNPASFNQDRKFVSFWTKPGGKDFDTGVLRVGADGAAATVVAGEIYVEYDIEFFNEIQEPSLDGYAVVYRMIGAVNAPAVITTGVVTPILWQVIGTIPGVTYDPLTGVFTFTRRVRVMARYFVCVATTDLLSGLAMTLSTTNTGTTTAFEVAPQSNVPVSADTGLGQIYNMVMFGNFGAVATIRFNINAVALGVLSISKAFIDLEVIS